MLTLLLYYSAVLRDKSPPTGGLKAAPVYYLMASVGRESCMSPLDTLLRVSPGCTQSISQDYHLV